MESITIEPIVSIRSNDIGIPMTTTKPTQWRSCCFTISPGAVKYFVQVGILAGLIIYSATMLVVNQSCESQRNYGSLLMVCLGCFLPTPKM